MNNKKKYVLMLLLVLVTISSYAQKIKTASGDISILAGEKELSVTFGYENLIVNGYSSEDDFIKEKVRIREAHNPGSGEIFRGSWFADRDTVYEPVFIKHFNDKLPKKRKIMISENNPNAKYNLHVQTLWVYPGYNVGFSQPSKIEVMLKLYEVANPENVVWTSTSPIRIEAKTTQYKRELRIASAYAALSQSISWLLKSKAK